MKRRTWAGLLGVVLVLGMAVLAATERVPYVTFAPGPTVNVLDKFEKKDIITVAGHKAYKDDGGLRLVTVVPSGPDEKLSIPQLVSAWVDPDRDVYPYQAIYPPTATRDSVREESSAQMVSSKDSAVAAAMRALDIRFKTAVKISDVAKDGPADGKLKSGDQVVSVNGRKITNLEQLTKMIRALPVGTDVTVVVQRGGKELEKKMATTGAVDDKSAAALRVTIAPGFEFPFEVKLNISENIGGPSGGLMFALGIYDVLTPGSLTDGKVIAGTGEIDDQGKVGPIGGIRQKLVGAQDDGAELFLVPAGNCAEALKGNYDPDKMRLVKVSTMEQALGEVQDWVKDPDAKLTRCTA